jgi:hypothetical protein
LKQTNAGCLFLVQLMLSGDVFKGRSDFTVYLATKKVSSSFGECAVEWSGVAECWLAGGGSSPSSSQHTSSPCCAAHHNHCLALLHTQAPR